MAYGSAAGLSIWLARRFVGSVSRAGAIVLVVLPLVLTGKAMLLGRLYGPSDLLAASAPWSRKPGQPGNGKPGGPGEEKPAVANPILSDLAFANIPWRAAVRESLANGRLPFWNRFVLAGSPLLAAGQAGIFHPSTWVGVLLPLPLSWTFSCAFTLFLAGLAAYLFFRDLGISGDAALFGAAAWGLSTYLVFWDGWSVGPSTATFPLLLLGLRRIARGEVRGISLTVTALLLSLAGGHPESLFHSAVAGGLYFLAELVSLRRRGTVRRAVGGALAAGVLAFLLAGPQLFPLLEAIPHSAEYRVRRGSLEGGTRSQSVPASQASARLLPALLPFAHGIYGKSPVQAERGDGSGMPLAYAGALLFPFAALGASRRRPGRGLFLVALLCGLLLGASAPGLLDVLTRLPGFALALNYRLVFLAPFGLAGLASLGLEAAKESGGRPRFAFAGAAIALALIASAVAARGVFQGRNLPEAFVMHQATLEMAPLLLAAGAALLWRGRRFAAAAFALLVLQRSLEMSGTYPTLPGGLAADPAPELAPARQGGARIAAVGSDLRPNEAALLGLEDVRGYESIVLDRVVDTYPLWCVAQPASFNRIDDLSRPFLSFLGARFAIASPDAAVPPGWIEDVPSASLRIFRNPGALERAFLPARLRAEPDSSRLIAAMASARDFSETVWVHDLPAGARESISNDPAARLSVREAGPDVLLAVEAAAPVFIATSLPDWPGWRADGEAGSLRIQTVNHAFVGLWVPPGVRRVRLHYVPPAFPAGVAAFAFGGTAAWLGALIRRRRRADARG